MIRELRERTDRLAFSREGGHAGLGKFAAHRFLGRRDGDGVPVALLKRGEIGGKLGQVIAGARDRQADEQQLALRIVADDGQHGAEELRVAE